MSWVVPLVLASIAIAIVVYFTIRGTRKHHVQHRQLTAMPTASVLIHDINDDRCTGCDACVSVCPTNVLDLVANKSRVLRFEDCIQCEACMHACPTEALVMFPEGTVPPVLKVPDVDANFQTKVPGQYLIGEVAGKPLVKNAANLGRMVVEHMMSTGLKPGQLGKAPGHVDVAIIGSGPAGLSAALTCLARGLSYVVLEKEQQIASTIARYPKGKLVMAEPYDTDNLSFLPVFDASKEQLIGVWREVLQALDLKIALGESVETVKPSPGGFDIKTTVAAYRAQRVVLAIGTRGKPRTLQVPGENLPKVYSLLEDPDEWRGKSVLVVGGGDSAVEASLALADAGATVTVSYRGKSFARAQQKNKQAIEAYGAEGRLKLRLQSQVVEFTATDVTLALGDGGQVTIPNHGAFVLIGADPPVAWLEKLGVSTVEKPHQFQLGKSDLLVRRFVPQAAVCPQEAAAAVAYLRTGEVTAAAAAGPKKWLRSATSLFSPRSRTEGSAMMPPPKRPAAEAKVAKPPVKEDRDGRKLEAPVPLSEFARRQRTNMGAGSQDTMPRDALSAGERTRILRMLRDEGARLADEDSSVYIGMAPAESKPMAGATSRGRNRPPDSAKFRTAAPSTEYDLPLGGAPHSEAEPRSASASAPLPRPAPPMVRSQPPSAPPPGRGAPRSVPPPLRAAAPVAQQAAQDSRLRHPPLRPAPARGAQPVGAPLGRVVEPVGRSVAAVRSSATQRAEALPNRSKAPTARRPLPPPVMTIVSQPEDAFTHDGPTAAADPTQLLALAETAARTPLAPSPFDEDDMERTSIADAQVFSDLERAGYASPDERTRMSKMDNQGRSLSGVEWDID